MGASEVDERSDITSNWWLPVSGDIKTSPPIEVLEFSEPAPDYPWSSISWRRLGEKKVVATEFDHDSPEFWEGTYGGNIWVVDEAWDEWREYEPLDESHAQKIMGVAAQLPGRLLAHILSQWDELAQKGIARESFSLRGMALFSPGGEDLVAYYLLGWFDNEGADYVPIASRAEGDWNIDRGNHTPLHPRALHFLGAEGITENPGFAPWELTEEEIAGQGFHPFGDWVDVPLSRFNLALALFDSPLVLSVRDLDDIMTLENEPATLQNLPPILHLISRVITAYGVEHEESEPLLAGLESYSNASLILGSLSSAMIRPLEAAESMISDLPKLSGRKIVDALLITTESADEALELDESFSWRTFYSRIIQGLSGRDSVESTLAPLELRAFSEKLKKDVVVEVHFSACAVRCSPDPSSAMKEFSEIQAHRLQANWWAPSDGLLDVEWRIDLLSSCPPELLIGCAAYVFRAFGFSASDIRVINFEN